MGLHEMRRAVLVLLVAAVAGIPAPAEAQPGSVAGPVAVRAADGSTLLLEGFGPVHGDLEIRRDGGSLSVVNALTLEDYVAGIAEVPGDWPMEALKAQAVAARTYVLWENERGYWKRFGFDVCATTSCQVYSGVLSERGEKGERWRRAVDETAGEVLLHDGRPALARYHASSGGRTLSNETVYPSSGPRPYLKAVDDPTDDVSPLHTWTVPFPRDVMQAILRDAIGLAGTLTQIEADPDARRVTIRTEGGELTMSTVRFRREVSGAAPRLYPDRYPGTRDDGLRMPLTMPSSRFTVERTGDGFVVHGRGYGHGVGMGQWGAMGRAERGDDYTEILAGYYNGLRPTAWEGVPERLRVGVVRGTQSVRISADGGFGVSVGPDTLASTTFGSWTFTASGGAIRVDPPEGFDLPLVLSGVSAPSEVVFDPPSGTSIEVAFVVPKAAEVTATLSRGDEELGSLTDVFEAGPGTIAVPLNGDRLGSDEVYRISVDAFDGSDRVSKDVQVRVRKPGGGPPVALAAIATLIGVAGVWLLLRRRRSTGPPESPRSPRPQPTGSLR